MNHISVFAEYTTQIPNDVFNKFDLDVITDDRYDCLYYRDDRPEGNEFIIRFKHTNGNPIGSYFVTDFMDKKLNELHMQGNNEGFILSVYQYAEVRAFLFGWFNAMYGSYASYKELLAERGVK